MRLTVDGIQPIPTSVTPRAFFTLENVDAAPETTGALTAARVVAPDGFVCRSGVLTSLDGFAYLEPGEKLTFQVYWECPNGALPETLSLDDAVVFQFAKS